MEILYFFNVTGVCGHIETWDFSDSKWDADGWLEKFGDRIGSGTAPLPSGGWIDLCQFATITKTR